MRRTTRARNPMRLIIGLSSVRSGQYANSSPIELHSREGERVGPSIPTPQPLKKNMFNTQARGYHARMYCGRAAVGSKKAPSSSAPLHSGWPKLSESRRGGALQKSILCCYFSSPSQSETVKPGTARKASPEGVVAEDPKGGSEHVASLWGIHALRQGRRKGVHLIVLPFLIQPAFPWAVVRKTRWGETRGSCAT